MAQEEVESRNGPMERLKAEAGELVGALGNRAVGVLRDKVGDATGRLTEYVEGGGGPGIMAAVTGARNLAEGKSPVRSMLGAGMAGVKEKVSGMFGRGGRSGGGARKLKLTNIAESIDVGVPLQVAYNQWTQYSDFPKFTKKLENVDRNKNEENKTNWKAQVFWSHRTWEATVIEQVPDERIIWRSKGQKGHVDGSVTFHELTPNLTRILLAMEYHPQGLFERTGNLWRAQGRRARLEFKHFRRHMMMQGILQADELEGWRGTIHDGEVVESHEDAVAREQKEDAGQDESRPAGDGQVEDEARSRGEQDEDSSRGEQDEDSSRGEQDDNRGRGAGRTAGQRGGRRRTRAEGGEAEAEDQGEDEESGNGRSTAARRRRAPGSGRGRSAGARSAGNDGADGGDGGDGRRRRAGATAQRGGSR